MTAVPTPQSHLYGIDDVDLSRIGDVLWAQKWIILIASLLSGLGGFLFATFQPGKPDQHIVVAFVEVGRYLTQTGGAQSLESPHDTVLILGQQNTGVSASVPRGSASLLSLEAKNVDPIVAKQQMDSALASVIKRHESLASRLPERILVPTGLVAEPTLRVDSIKDKRLQLCLASAIGGLLFAIILVFLVYVVKHRKQAKLIY